jgi:hypothetical protein
MIICLIGSPESGMDGCQRSAATRAVQVMFRQKYRLYDKKPLCTNTLTDTAPWSRSELAIRVPPPLPRFARRYQDNFVMVVEVI